MLYEFKSRATGSVVMMGPVAERLLGIIGKTGGPTGIITVEQMPQAITNLRAAIDDERRARQQAVQAAGATDHSAGETEPAGAGVSLEQRAVPLIEMLERALKARRDITWGV